MPLRNLLYIYDNSDRVDRSQADGQFSQKDDVYTVSVGSTQELVNALDKCISDKLTFTHALFQTHGSPGYIYFGDEKIYAGNLAKLPSKNYQRLFPLYAVIYFDGCNVAAGDEGYKFLLQAGKVFLLNHGGKTLGWTNLEVGIPGWFPISGGHTVHPFGSIKSIEFGPGGIVVPEAPIVWPEPAHGRDNVGTKI